MTSRAVAAGYVAAVFAEDKDLLEQFRHAYSAKDLLEAIEPLVRVMGRRIALGNDQSLAEYGGALLEAALIHEAL